jgi:uncharacterized phage-like protein YoqJ
MIVAATGHRPKDLNKEYDYSGPYSKYILKKFNKFLTDNKKKISKVITGMALGVDTLWALSALNSNIPIIAAIPFKGQESRWGLKSKNLYFEILANPLVTTKIISKKNSKLAYLQRNMWMVSRCDKIIVVIKKNITSGGTFHCYKYALNAGIPIYKIDPEGFKNEN